MGTVGMLPRDKEEKKKDICRGDSLRKTDIISKKVTKGKLFGGDEINNARKRTVEIGKGRKNHWVGGQVKNEATWALKRKETGVGMGVHHQDASAECHGGTICKGILCY